MNKTFAAILGIITLAATAVLAEDLRICKAAKLSADQNWESICLKLLKQGNKEKSFLLTGNSLIQEQTEYNKLADEQTEFASGHDDRNLYLSIRCYDSRGGSLTAKCTEADGPVWNDDSIEIFIAPQYKVKNYYHFIVNPLGTKYDEHGENRNWGCEWKTKVLRENNAWVVLCTIPLEAVEIRAGNSVLVGFNICRTRHAHGLKEVSSWSYSSGSFHNTDEFGAMIIGDPNLSLRNFINLCAERRERIIFKPDENLNNQSAGIQKMATQIKLLMNELDAMFAKAKQPETKFEEMTVLCSQINSLLSEYEKLREEYQKQTNVVKATLWL